MHLHFHFSKKSVFQYSYQVICHKFHIFIANTSNRSAVSYHFFKSYAWLQVFYTSIESF